MDRRLALVTGASAGIGAAFARIFAIHGYDVALTARRAERLESLADEIRMQFGVETLTVSADLARPGAVDEVLAHLAGHGRVVDALVNNAGYGLPGRFVDTAWADQQAFLQVMVTAPCELAHKLLPGMAERRFGRIVNVASLAGLVPGAAGHTLYAASKALLVRFSQSLHLEGEADGVHVTALCPGFTTSEFHDVTGTRSIVSRMPAWMWLGADDVARQGIDAVERGEAVWVTGKVNRLIKALVKLVPDRMALRAVQKRSKNFRAQ